MTNKSETCDCPFCKEKVLVDAIKCKHCGSKLSPTMPSHEGTCPFCKEEILPEAIKCKHCKSNLVDSSGGTSETPRDPIESVALRVGLGGVGRPSFPSTVVGWDKPARRNCDDCDLLLLSCLAADLPGMECWRQWQFCQRTCW